MHSKKMIAASAFILLHRLEKPKRLRSLWIRHSVEERRSLGAYSILLRELKITDPRQFTDFVKMRPIDFENLVCKIGPLASKQDTSFRKAITVEERLILTLRYLVTGDSYAVLSKLFKFPKSTVSSIVPQICEILVIVLQDQYVPAPSTPEDWYLICNNFESKWNFPKCLGAVDGLHIFTQAQKTEKPHKYESQPSIILTTVVDANYKFLIVTTSENIKNINDKTLEIKRISNHIQDQINSLLQTPFNKETMNIPHTFVASDAFPLQPHIMKPYSNVNTNSMEIFNHRLSIAKHVVENAFGLMISVFKVLNKQILISPERVSNIILASCCLHNFLLSEKESADVYAPEGTLDKINILTGEVEKGSWRHCETTLNFISEGYQDSNIYSKKAKNIREEFMNYFTNPKKCL